MTPIQLTEEEMEALELAVKILNNECFNYTADVIQSLLARAGATEVSDESQRA